MFLRALHLRTWLGVSALTLLAFGWVIPGYLTNEDFYIWPRTLEVPFAQTLRTEWLLEATADDPLATLAHYRPLGRTWWHAKMHLWRGWIPGLRLDQLVFNVVISIAVGAVALQWTRDGTLATYAAVLSVAAPGRVRLVAMTYGGKNFLAALASLYCLGLLFRAVKDGSNRALAGALIATLLGLLCYEQVLVVPIAALVCTALICRGPWKRYAVPCCATAAVLGGYLLFRWRMLGGLGGYERTDGTNLIAMHSPLTLLGQLVAAESYMFRSLATPVQPPDYQLPPIAQWAAVGLGFALLAWSWRRRGEFGPALAAALAWIVITTAPFLGIVSEPHAWLPYPFFASFGGAIIAAVVVRALIPERLQGAAVAILLAVQILPIWHGAFIWRDTWNEARAFRTQLAGMVPAEATPAFVYIDNLPGPRAEAGNFTFLSTPDHDVHTGYLPSHVFLRRASQEWPNPNPYNGLRAWAPADSWHLHWLTWNPKERTLARNPHPPATPTAGHAASWSLETPGDQRAWTPANQLRRVLENVDPPMYETQGPFALLQGPELQPDLGTPIVAEVLMQIQSQATQRGIAEWQWRVAGDDSTSPAHIVRFWVEHDGAPHAYRMPLINNAMLLIDGGPVRVDLRPTNTPGAVVQVQRITLAPRSIPE